MSLIELILCIWELLCHEGLAYIIFHRRVVCTNFDILLFYYIHFLLCSRDRSNVLIPVYLRANRYIIMISITSTRSHESTPDSCRSTFSFILSMLSTIDRQCHCEFCSFVWGFLCVLILFACFLICMLVCLFLFLFLFYIWFI